MLTNLILGGPWWRSIPNFISAARLASLAVLLLSIYLLQLNVFRWLLLICLLSDILDGWIARRFHLESATGAKLDSIADMGLHLTTLVGVWVFQREFVLLHGVVLFLVAAFYAAEALLAVQRYGRISSFHTLLTRIAAYAQGIFVVCLFFWGYWAWLFYAFAVLSLLASTEEMILLWLLPEWAANVGGLYWVLRRNQEKT